jgi:dihydrofolate synthase/folylpolyglutamate synthase
MSGFFRDWAAFSSYLDGLGLFRMRPGAEAAAKVLERLGLRRPGPPLVQVAGTNGKGSCCAFLAALGSAHGLRCALYTSPHFLSPRERLRILSPGGGGEGESPPEEAWLAAAETVLAAGGESLTYFELLTLMAACLLHSQKAELAVMESGLGGSFDAVTALAADLVLFTPIDLDHQALLGDSLGAIAADKAGAIRREKPALSAPQAPEAASALLAEAGRRKAALRFVAAESLEAGIRLSLAGEHQRVNAALALEGWKLLAPLCGVSFSEKKARAGLASAWIPGRLQRVPACSGLPSLLLDGGHNRHGLAALGLSLARLGLAPGAVIFSCLADKEPQSLIPHLRALSTGPVFVPPVRHNPRAMPAEELAALIGLAAVPCADLPEALERAAVYYRERLPEELAEELESSAPGRHPLLICGSLYLLAEFYAPRPELLRPGPFAGCGQGL